jgi:DNA-binding XRE family transcriptional regulator
VPACAQPDAGCLGDSEAVDPLCRTPVDMTCDTSCTFTVVEREKVLVDRQAIADARRRLGHQLAELRKAAGYSQHAFAPLTHYTRSTIANVEVGRQHAPRSFWQLCDDVLSANGTLTGGYDDLQALIRQHHEALARALREKSEEGAGGGDYRKQDDLRRREVPFDPMRRRTFVTWGLATTAAGGLGLASVGAVGAADVRRLQRTEVRLQRLAHRHGGESLWQAAAASADEGYHMLEQGSYGPRVGKQLLMAIGGLQLCAGWLAFDAGRHDAARASYTDALTLSRQVSDPEMEARALADLARESYVFDRPREAQRLATAAGNIAASTGGSPRLVAISSIRHAVASSLMGDAPGADSAITQARKALDRDRDEPVEEWGAFLTPFEIDGIEATCALELGQASRAEALLEQIIVAYESSQFRRNCALYRVRLARARLDSGAVDGAAEAATAAVDDLAGELASRRVSSELDAVACRLADYPDVPGVDRFLAAHDAISI